MVVSVLVLLPHVLQLLQQSFSLPLGLTRFQKSQSPMLASRTMAELSKTGRDRRIIGPLLFVEWLSYSLWRTSFAKDVDGTLIVLELSDAQPARLQQGPTL